jgi:5-deoxy-5-amino-3-dehydroquinate synthase
MIRVDVDLADRSYPVIVGSGARNELPDVISGLEPKRVAVVTQPGIAFPVEPGRESKVFDIGEGERFKSLTTVEHLCSEWATWGFTRRDVVVAVGGGAVTDTAGFAAAIYHRGVRVVHVPTTLLGMVDAAIGGKTGVNLDQGKNLVGSFWQPSAVLCDLDALATLPERELLSGQGELAKYHFLTGADLLGLPMDERIAAAVRIKADVIRADEREDPANLRGRATLNYGHTLGHALETSGHFDLRHGEAVAIGLVYAAELARRIGRIDQRRVDMHREIVHAYGLRTTLPERSDPAELVWLMQRDKKSIDGLTFVLDGPDGPEVVVGVPEADVLDALEAVR